MYETQDELTALQQLLDGSHGRSTEHLRSIIDDDRTLTATDLAGLLTGMKVLSLATVTARGEPRISAVDGHFLHGTWTFSTSGTAAKATQLRSRPACSVAHIDGEELGVFAHGDAVELHEGDAAWAETIEHWTKHYGSSPLSWAEDIRIYRLRPSWMVGYAFKRADLLVARGLTSA